MSFSFFKSIRGKMILMMFGCWFVPMCIIVLVSAVSLREGVEKISTEYLRAEISYGTQMVSERINKAIDLSRRASYDKEIERAVEQYIDGRISETTLIIKVNNYITMNYYGIAELNFAAVFLECTPSIIYGNSNSKVFTEINNYARERHREVTDFASTLDTYLGFYVDSENNLYLVRNLLQYDEYVQTRKSIGSIVFKLNRDYILSELTEKSKLNHDVAAIFNESVLLLGADVKYSSVESIMNSKDKIKVIDDKTYVFTQIKTRDYTSILSVGTDNKVLYREYRQMRDSIVAIVLFVLPVLAFATAMFYRSITNPIKNLVRAIEKIERGNLGIQVPKSSSDEFDYLFNAFNSMSKKLSHLFDRVYKEQLNAKDAKIMALQSQMNPHFLFNTLEVMNWQARMSDNKIVGQMIEALSVMLDASLNRANKRLVVLSEELAYADAYLFLMSMRFGERMEIFKNIDKGLLEEKVPSLIIQPLLENAVKYGLDATHGGKIELQIYKEVDLIIKIKNTGMKLKEEDRIKIDELLNSNDPESTSLGIRNVQTRLKLIYGDTSGLKIYEENGETVAIININLDENITT